MSKPSFEYVFSRLRVDVEAGIATWIDATKHHRNLNGRNAGSARNGGRNKKYWHIKIDGVAYKRSHLVFLAAYGRWPELHIDHIDGDSLNDKLSNLREATQTQNAWNHKTRSKKSSLPMGVRTVASSGRYQARIACNKKMIHLGAFDTPEQASAVYQQKRKELFGEYSGY